MASLSTDKRGNRTIQFVAADRKRRSVRLGKVPKRIAEEVRTRIQSLNASAIAGVSWEREVADWVAKREPWLYDKLAAVELVPRRAPKIEPVNPLAALGAFLNAYIAGRTDVKDSTETMYQRTRDNLVTFFGEAKPLVDISAGDADDFRRWMMAPAKGTKPGAGLGDNTARRRCGVARQFFRAAVRKRLLAENPFGEMKGVSVRADRSRDYFVTREEAAKVLDACPDAEWRLIFALSRYGGLRCPSEHMAMRWVDVDWARKRMTVRSPKTEHHEGGESRVVPIFPELRPYLEDAFDPESEFVVSRRRGANVNLRTQLERIIAKAKLTPWPKLFQNLRATRATELANEFPSHLAAKWLGHSEAVASKHYRQVTDADFERAATDPTGVVQNPVQQQAAPSGMEGRRELVGATISGNPEEYGVDQCSLLDSNQQPTD